MTVASEHDPDIEVAPPITRKRSWRPDLSNPRWVLFLVLVGATVFWEGVTRVGIVDTLFVSYPSEMLAAVPDLVASHLARSALAITGLAMVLAILYGTALGVGLGYLMGFFPAIRGAFYGPALFLMSVPKSIFIPIFMVLIGINTQTAVYYGAFSASVYVLVNVVSGFDLVEQRHLEVARAYRAGVRHRIFDVVLPASLPGLFTGIWYGIKNGLQGVLIVELFISVGGLGRLISQYADQGNTDRVFALVIFVSILAILAGSLWSALEKHLSRWRQPTVTVGTP